MHDASEAYLLDIPRPIKNKLSNYKEIEDNLMSLIASKFGFEYPLFPEVKAIDDLMLQREWDQLMLGRLPKNLKEKLYFVSQKGTYNQFLRLFKRLSEPNPF